MTASSSIQQLFSDYENAYNKLDLRTQVGAFADNFVMAGPKGVISQTQDDFIKNADKAIEFYRSVGMNSARILSMKESPISEQYTMVLIHWGVTFEKTGDKMEEFDVSYIVHNAAGHPEIIMAIAHQDEDEAMKKLGDVAV